MAPAAPMSAGDRAAQNQQAQNIQQIKPNLYVVTGAGGNVTVRVTPKGIVLVDTKNAGDANYNQLMALIHGVSEQPVKLVIDSHHHGDHSGNNGRFMAAGAQVIGHSAIAAHMAVPAAAGREQGVPPNAPYSGRRTIVRLGDTKTVVYHFASGHTDDDSVVYFPDFKTVATGDLFVNVTPLVDYGGGGTLLGTQKAITETLKLDFDTVVPGHGLPVQRQQVAKYKTDLDNLVSRLTLLIRAGVPKDELMTRVKSDDLGWSLASPQWSRPSTVASIYDELVAVKH
jgi:glyoxylase-like metal-dependent hydrolase (beta-lactamase superfamily II)